MLHIVCLTKTYRLDDIDAWLQYHSFLNATVWLIDNDSIVEQSVMKELSYSHSANYFHISGFADQWHLFSNILNQKTDIKFKENDLVCFLDDDEYLYFNCERQLLEQTIRNQFKQLDCILLPEVLISTRKYREKRKEILPLFSTYRRNDYSSQGKAIVWWNSWHTYDYTLHSEEKGHVPWIDGRRYSEVVGSGVSKTTYGLTPADLESQPIALVHYHIKSQEDWKMKIERGSAATQSTEERQNGSYDSDIHKDLKFGNYIIQDLTMKILFEKVTTQNKYKYEQCPVIN